MKLHPDVVAATTAKLSELSSSEAADILARSNADFVRLVRSYEALRDLERGRGYGARGAPGDDDEEGGMWRGNAAYDEYAREHADRNERSWKDDDGSWESERRWWWRQRPAPPPDPDDAWWRAFFAGEVRSDLARQDLHRLTNSESPSRGLRRRGARAAAAAR